MKQHQQDIVESDQAADVKTASAKSQGGNRPLCEPVASRVCGARHGRNPGDPEGRPRGSEGGDSPKFQPSCSPNRCTEITEKMEVTNMRMMSAEETGCNAGKAGVSALRCNFSKPEMLHTLSDRLQDHLTRC